MENWKKIVLRAAAFGAGVALTALIVLGILAWWNGRPPRPLNTHAITATFAGMEIQTGGEVFWLKVSYGLHNNTDRGYQLPTIGQFMIVNSENKGLDTVDGVKWDSNATIPPGQTVNVKFEIPYQLSEYNHSAADLVPFDKLVEFANRRVKQTDGFRFFDYAQRFEIDFPSLPVTEQKPLNLGQSKCPPIDYDAIARKNGGVPVGKPKVQ